MNENFQFAVRIGATDDSGRAFDAVKGRLQTLTKTAHGAGQEIDRGFWQARRAIGDFAEAPRDVAGRLTAIAPALGVLTGAGSIAGLATLTRDFGQFGMSVSNTAATLGISTRDVQLWQGAFERGGLSAADATSSIAGLNKALLGARAGTNAQALAVSRWFGIDINAKPLQAMRQIANIVKGMNDRGENVESQSQLLESMGIGRNFLSIAQGGAAAIDKLKEAKERHGVATDDEVAKGKALFGAWLDLGDSATLLGHSIASNLTPTFKPMLENISTWLDKNKEWISQDIAGAAGKFGDALKNVPWKDIGKDVKDIADDFGSLYNWILEN